MSGKIIDKLGWLHIRDRKLLVLRSRGKDKFFIPGGKREEGESDEQALLREIKEELGVALKPETIKHLHTVKAQAYGLPEGVFVQIKGYGAEHAGEPKPESEIEEMAWFTTADIPQATEPMKLMLLWLKEQDLID